jgi:CDP-glycerol glycerophosphotransferase
MFLLIKKFIFFFLDLLIPKDDSLILCPYQRGMIPNSANLVLADYIEKNLPHLKVIRATNKTSKFLILRAKYVFLTHGPGDIKFAMWSPRKIVTYIGHGVPLKGFYFTNKNPKFFENLIQRIEVPFYKYIIASSKADQKNLMKCFNKNEENVLITGLPRNELLLRKSNTLSELFGKYEKIILYAPTYRDSGEMKFFPFHDLNLEKMNEEFAQKNILLLVRGHMNNKNQNHLNSFSHIKNFNADLCPDISYVLNEFDLMITDYSSIYIDFLLTMKPVIFFPYDLEKYQNERGLLYNYQEVTPGPHVFNQKDFIRESIHLLSDHNYYQEERLRVKKIFHQYEKDFSQRLVGAVIEGNQVH